MSDKTVATKQRTWSLFHAHHDYNKIVGSTTFYVGTVIIAIGLYGLLRGEAEYGEVIVGAGMISSGFGVWRLLRYG